MRQVRRGWRKWDTGKWKGRHMATAWFLIRVDDGDGLAWLRCEMGTHVVMGITHGHVYDCIDHYTWVWCHTTELQCVMSHKEVQSVIPLGRCLWSHLGSRWHSDIWLTPLGWVKKFPFPHQLLLSLLDSDDLKTSLHWVLRCSREWVCCVCFDVTKILIKNFCIAKHLIGKYTTYIKKGRNISYTWERPKKRTESYQKGKKLNIDTRLLKTIKGSVQMNTDQLTNKLTIKESVIR